MMVRGLRGIFLLAVGLAAGGLSAATTPVEWLKHSTNQVMDRVYDPALQDQSLLERIEPLLREHFHIEGVTRGAVGFPWRQFSPEQRERVVELFSEVVMRTYARRFDPGQRPEVQYGNTTKLPRNRWEIATTITYQGAKYAVSYRLETHGEGYRIYDVIAEGVSLVSNYRAQFDSILKKDGVDGLIAALESNLENLEGNK